MCAQIYHEMKLFYSKSVRELMNRQVCERNVHWAKGEEEGAAQRDSSGCDDTPHKSGNYQMVYFYILKASPDHKHNIIDNFGLF